MFPLKQFNLRHVIIACDGLWDEVTSEEAAQMVMEKGAEQGAPALRDLAFERGSSDNISVICIDVGESKA